MGKEPDDVGDVDPFVAVAVGRQDRPVRRDPRHRAEGEHNGHKDGWWPHGYGGLSDLNFYGQGVEENPFLDCSGLSDAMHAMHSVR